MVQSQVAAPMKVLIADDHQLFAESVRWALEAGGLDVAGIASGASEALELARATQPDVVLIDVLLPDGDGIEAGRSIVRALPDTVVIAVTSVADKDTVAEAFRAGFRGYVPKDSSLEKLVGRITFAVLHGSETPRRAELRLGRESRDSEHVSLILQTLTRREREILARLADGATGQAIADELGLSRNTIRTHVQNILTKLQVGSRLEAAAYVVRHGLMPTLERSRPHASA